LRSAAELDLKGRGAGDRISAGESMQRRQAKHKRAPGVNGLAERQEELLPGLGKRLGPILHSLKRFDRFRGRRDAFGAEAILRWCEVAAAAHGMDVCRNATSLQFAARAWLPLHSHASPMGLNTQLTDVSYPSILQNHHAGARAPPSSVALLARQPSLPAAACGGLSAAAC